jgi:arginine deiminase
MSAVRVNSEIGRLREVMLHRPGREIDRMVPAMMERLLFDDILYGDEAREEHDLFRGVFERAGVEVVEAQDLLAEALASGDARSELLAELESELEEEPEVIERLSRLAAPELAEALIAGLRSESEPEEGAPAERLFDFDPVPNYFFQRDPQAVIGERVMVSAMATEAREREPLLGRAIFKHHPDFAGGPARIDLARPGSSSSPSSRRGRPRARAFPLPHIEGGDVLVASPEILLVGVSERTNRRGLEGLAEYFRYEETSFRHMIHVELPARRSCMHLDTVFTLIDHDTCLGYLPVVQPGHAESAHVYHVDLTAKELSFAVRPSLLEALAGVGMRLDIVPCGGAADPVEQQREQWTDGANAFAIAPGVIFSYQRNRRTLDELDRRGWRVISDEDVVHGGADPIDGPTVVTLAGNELSRARGGPRCMTAPLVRDDL